MRARRASNALRRRTSLTRGRFRCALLAVTVVSFGFKHHRFTELHRSALRLPRSRFRFVGIDPPKLSIDVMRAELTHSAKPFERDPYGCAEETLRRKRASRNPFRRQEGYAASCPELAGLLAHCARSRYAGPLPWSRLVGDDEDHDQRGVNESERRGRT